MKWRNILFVVIATIMIAAHGTYSQEKPVGEVSVQQARPNESLEALFPKAETVAPGSSFHERALEDLLSTNATVRYDATLALSGQRSALVAGLIRILDGSNAVDIKVYAVVVLGQYRAAEAVPILVQHWEWDQEGGHVVLGTSGPQRIERDEFSRPVSTALVNIGSRAIPYLLDRIASAGDVATMWKCVAICREIEGLDVTEMRLQNRLDKATDETVKRNMRSALDDLKLLRAEAMGAAGIPELLNKITETDDTNVVVRCIINCQLIEGPDATQSRLQALLQSVTDEKKKQRIQFALVQLTSRKVRQIGAESIPTLLNSITETDDTNRVAFSVKLCVSLEGLQMTESRLQGLWEKETDQKRKLRLKSALDILRSIKPQN